MAATTSLCVEQTPQLVGFVFRILEEGLLQDLDVLEVDVGSLKGCLEGKTCGYARTG